MPGLQTQGIRLYLRPLVKNRIPRQAVIDAVESFRQPFTVADLARTAKKHHPRIGRASVYRTLNKLIAEGHVHSVILPTGSRVFVASALNTSALVYCERCQTVQILPDDGLRDHIAHTMKSLGFVSDATPVCLSVRCEKEHFHDSHSPAP